MKRGRTLSLICLLAASGCIAQKQSGATLSRYGEPEAIGEVQPGTLTFQAAFEATVYPLVRAHCALCHAGVQSPFFAGSSPSDAMTAALSRADFSSPASSLLVNRAATAGHCPTCGPERGAEMETAILRWDLYWNGID